MRRILRMISLGKLWIIRSLSFFQTMIVFFSRFMPTSCPSAVRYRFSMGQLLDSAQKTGSALFSSFQRLTPWLLMLQYSLVSPLREMTFLKCSLSLVKDPISLPPFFEHSVILLSLISLQVSRSMSATQVSYFIRLYLSSSFLIGSIYNMLLVPRQKRYTLGVESMDSMMATSRRSSLHSSNSGRRTSTASYLRSTLPSAPIFQQNMSLFSPSSSDVRMLIYPFLASTFSIMASISTVSMTCSCLMQTTVNLYMPKTTTRWSLSGLILAQNWSSLCSTSMDFLNTMPSSSQMNSSVPSMSSRQFPSTVVSQSDGRERQYLLHYHANPPYYFMTQLICSPHASNLIKTTNLQPLKSTSRLRGRGGYETHAKGGVFGQAKGGVLFYRQYQSTLLKRYLQRYQSHFSKIQCKILAIIANRSLYGQNIDNNLLTYNSSIAINLPLLTQLGLFKIDWLRLWTDLADNQLWISKITPITNKPLKKHAHLQDSIISYQSSPIGTACRLVGSQNYRMSVRQQWGEEGGYLAINGSPLILFRLIRGMGSDQAKPLVPGGELKLNHHYFQKAALVKEGDKQFVQSLFDCQDKEYDAWKKTITDTTKPLNHEFLYLPEKTGYQHGKELCSNTGTAINLYPDYPVILADEIKKRAVEKTYFKESELWYLLYSLIAAKNDLQAYGGRLGDINPHNIFINNERKVKVGNIYSIPGETTGFAKVVSKKGHEHVLLPPEDLVEAKKNAIDNKTNSKSEIFSIGATVLSAGILDDLSAVYDFKLYGFNSKEFDEKKKEWINHEKYSEIFKSTILNLVNELPEKRLSQAELWNYVSPHAGSIKNKEQFLINHPPALIESHVSVVRSKAL